MGAMGGLIVTGLLLRDEITDMLAGKGIPELLVGNVFDPAGAPGTGALAGGRPTLFPPAIWASFDVIALLATASALALLGGFLVA